MPDMTMIERMCAAGITQEQARAILEAMREPTDAMAIRGGESLFDAVGQEGDDGDTLNDQDHAISIYQAMISAALKETT